MKTPKVKCKGCKCRDEMIRKLSLRVDELERKSANAPPTTENTRLKLVRNLALND